MATGGFDGQLIVWNMVSGHQLANLSAPEPTMEKSRNPAIIISREQSVEAETLVSAVPFDNGKYSSRLSTAKGNKEFEKVTEKVKIDTAIRKIIFLPK